MVAITPAAPTVWLMVKEGSSAPSGRPPVCHPHLRHLEVHHPVSNLKAAFLQGWRVAGIPRNSQGRLTKACGRLPALEPGTLPGWATRLPGLARRATTTAQNSTRRYDSPPANTRTASNCTHLWRNQSVLGTEAATHWFIFPPHPPAVRYICLVGVTLSGLASAWQGSSGSREFRFRSILQIWQDCNSPFLAKIAVRILGKPVQSTPLILHLLQDGSGVCVSTKKLVARNKQGPRF